MKSTMILVLMLSASYLSAQMGPGGPPKAVDVSGIKNKTTGVAYAKDSPTQTLDVYWPATGKGPFPVIFSVHGGGFAFGDNRGPELASALKGLERGYAVVGVNYRLSGEAAYPAAINDVQAAIQFIRQNAEKWNLDTARFAAWGSSAGGHLVALAGTMGQGLSKLQAVVDQYGPIDFLTMDDQFRASGIAGQVHNTAESFESKYMGAHITSIPAKVKQANPTTYIDASDPFFFIQHGSADKNIPTKQSVDFAGQLSLVLGKERVVLEILDGAGHGGEGFETPANLTKIFDWLDRVLAK